MKRNNNDNLFKILHIYKRSKRENAFKLKFSTPVVHEVMNKVLLNVLNLSRILLLKKELYML